MKNKKEIEEKIKEAEFQRDKLLTATRNNKFKGQSKINALDMIEIFTREISSLEWVLEK